MAAMLKQMRNIIAIIEGLRAGRSATKIIPFFGYPRSTVYDVVAKYTALEQSNEGASMPARKSRKNALRGPPSFVESAQDDPMQLLRKLSIVGVSENNASSRTFDKSYKDTTLKILSETVRTSRVARLGSHFGLSIAQI